MQGDRHPLLWAGKAVPTYLNSLTHFNISLSLSEQR